MAHAKRFQRIGEPLVEAREIQGPLPSAQAAVVTVDAGAATRVWTRERLLLAAVAGVVLSQLLGTLAIGVFTVWSGTRLAFSAAVAHGFDIYPTARGGVVTGNMYGPVMAIFYLPALLAPGVTAKLLLGELLSVLVMIVPVALLFERELRPRGGSTMFIGAALVAMVGVLLAISSTRYQLTSIHADAPCLGLGMCSYLLLSFSKRPTLSRVFAAAFLVALATLSKPLGAFVGVAELLILLYTCGVRPAVSFAAAASTATIVLGLVLPRAIGSTFEGMWFNVLVLPSRQAVELSVYHANVLLRPLIALAALTAATIWFRRSEGRDSDTNEARRTRHAIRDLWTIALVVVPISFVAYAKVGGDVNSLYAHYYASIAAVLGVADVAVQRRAAVLPLVALACAAAILSPLESLRGIAAVPKLLDNQHERVATYLRQHDEAYFPWHSLSTILVRGQFFHHTDGIHSRKLAGLTLSQEQFYAHAPRNPTYVIMPPVGKILPRRFVHLELVSEYYPGYVSEAVQPAELQAIGMQVFRRP